VQAAVVLLGAMLALKGRGEEQRLGAGDRVLLRPPTLQRPGREQTVRLDIENPGCNIFWAQIN
jgi:hypothetical protein